MNDGSVAVLGGGSMGTTLANIVASAGRPCILWCATEEAARSVNDEHRHEKLFKGYALATGLRASTDLAATVRGASIVVCAVRSTEFGTLAKRLAPLVTRDQILLSATKGLDLASLKPMSELLSQECSANVVGAIAGPNVTHDMMANRLSAIVVSTTAPEATATSARYLETEVLRVYTNDDLVGVEWFAVLKNVVAIAVAVGIGLDLAVNTRSILITRAIAEICHVAEKKGARRTTFWGLCGVGDLYLTTTSPHSLNRDLGILLGQGQKLAEIVARCPSFPRGSTRCEGVTSSHTPSVSRCRLRPPYARSWMANAPLKRSRRSSGCTPRTISTPTRSNHAVECIATSSVGCRCCR